MLDHNPAATTHVNLETSTLNGPYAARVDALRRRHLSLGELVEEEHRRPLPDATRLTDLKRQKLRLKDELERLRGVMRTLSKLQATR